MRVCSEDFHTLFQFLEQECSSQEARSQRQANVTRTEGPRRLNGQSQADETHGRDRGRGDEPVCKGGTRPRQMSREKPIGRGRRAARGGDREKEARSRRRGDGRGLQQAGQLDGEPEKCPFRAKAPLPARGRRRPEVWASCRRDKGLGHEGCIGPPPPHSAPGNTGLSAHGTASAQHDSGSGF